MTSQHLGCSCGDVTLRLEGDPIVSVECCCTSCRTAAARMAALPGAPRITAGNGATPLVLYRMDHVQIVRGHERLAGFRLAPTSRSRRIVATCCNSPVFLDFEPGPWLSVYASLWPVEARPPAQMRTMTEDMADTSCLSSDLPNPKKHTPSFFFKLFGAWAAMRFRVPKLAVARELDVPESV